MPLPPLNAPLAWTSNSADMKALLDDLQANILKGHGRHKAAHVFLQFDSAKAADIKAAIHQLSGHLKTARQQLEDAKAHKDSGQDGGTVRCFFLTFAGYQALGAVAKAPAGVAGSAFRKGMKTRAILNDPPATSWDGTFRPTVHAMLLLADNNALRLASETQGAVAALEAVGAEVLGIEEGNQQHNARGNGVEHFGYVDGRSQALWLQEDVEDEALNTDGVSMWNPAFPPDQVLVTAGAGAAQQVTGSFFVFRKLEQNVLAFKEKEEQLASDLRLRGDEAELAGAMVVGRFEDGTPVVLRNRDGIGGVVPNNFNYDDDPAGAKCPFHAHVRKTNPRNDSPAGPIDTPERRHLMARRGITYGERQPGMVDKPEGGVGLLFMAYQSRLENQFEFTQATWANSPTFPPVPAGKPQPGIDPVIGQGSNPPDTQHCPLKWGDASKGTQASDFSGFVTMKGGEYFFAPVISALRTL